MIEQCALEESALQVQPNSEKMIEGVVAQIIQDRVVEVKQATPEALALTQAVIWTKPPADCILSVQVGSLKWIVWIQ